ncbi:Maternal protein tudor [Ooceraea biroi]|uniref:Maternal protein tudor n=1 Tax=Ooceraea biroi TaxID=2015173 RepID=A0A026VVD0_OOCBI|nr:Maternal protein tudor [Ooceraea biroi]
MPQPHQMPMYQQQNKNNFAMLIAQNPNLSQANIQELFRKAPTLIQQQFVEQAVRTQPPPPLLPAQEALVFKSRVLDVGTNHDVLVSYVEDGPQKFSVQVESTKDILTRLMNEINNHPKQPLQEPPLPGSVCLGRYTGDGVLCRAVVMSVMEHKCKLYYVDFGHTEILPYTDIFQLPPEYINPKVLSIRFTLSGLKELNITQEMKDYFKSLVWRKLLVLRVRPPEGPPLIQYGDLYAENGVNVKELLKKAFPVPATAVPITYSYPQLKQLSKDVQEVVQVSYVESCKTFFVQLESGIRSLESIMLGLEQYVKTAPALSAEQIKVGLPCAALYDLQWYRARVIDVTGDQIKVMYVDYGNEEALPITSLRTIHADLVTKLPAQAVRCTLNGYEHLSSDQEVSNLFEKLTLEKRSYMKVIAAQANGLLVDLFEFDTMKNIHPQLLNNLFYDKTSNSAGSRNEEVQYSAMPTNDFPSEEKDRYNKNTMNSWNHNQKAKSFQDNKSDHWKDEWSEEKRHDNRRERTGNHSHYDGSQNDRFPRDETTNNRFSKDRSYNKHDRGEINTSNRSGRGGYQNGSKFNSNERRYNRDNPDKAYNDKDSDASIKNGNKRGRSYPDRNDSNNGRARNRDSGISGRLQTANWNDKQPNQKSSRFTGDYGNNKFKDRENNANVSYNQENVLYNQEVNACESWDSANINASLQNNVAVNDLQLSSINIVFDISRNCEVVFINSPSDFFIQLSPDCLELDTVMENIASVYENSYETMQASKIRSGVFCIAQYSEDLKWYRAIIKSVENNSASVEFVDYGNTESVDFTKIKEIREEFLKLPMQAIHCRLFGLASTDNKENGIFSEQVEGKLLQVEFVAEKNRLYEIVLHEMTNGAPNANSINEACGVDLAKAREIAECKTTAQVLSVDYASFDAKWQIIPYEAESRHDVIITWLINPNKLYCQSLAREAEFKLMMNEIQKTYAGREAIKRKLEIGSIVIAIFSEDRALYRAEVVSRGTQRDAYIVQYIDFGNCATVNQRNIYEVEKAFMQLPKLAMQCSLKDIVPCNDSSWSNVDNDTFDSCFNADKYECIFHSSDNNQYTVSLIHNGQDVGKMLVENNLAAFATPIETAGAAETFSDATYGAEALNNVERVDISLLSGQTLKMRISSVEDSTRFYVQLPSASKCENIVDTYMEHKNTEALALPGELAVMQNQALECCLQNVPTSSDADKQLKELKGKEVLVYVEEVSNNRLLVKLYDLLGNGILNTEKEDGKISPICSMPILSSTHDVSVSYAEHSAGIWLQRYADLDIETKLLGDLEQYYEQSKSGQGLKPEMHLLCAAKCSDGRWYRARIVNCTETTAYVHYIDYGNVEEVALGSIMALEPQFYQPHQLAINVSLSVALAGTVDEQINVLQLYLMNKALGAVFYNVHKKWIVDLTENGEKLSDKLRALNLVKEEQPTLDEPASQTQEESTTTNKFSACVSHADSPSQFWLQRADAITSLNEKQEQLQLEVPDFPRVEGIPEEGTLCVAVYSIDNLWYRAEVLDADEDITTVRFVDYGNTDVITNKTGDIRQIPDAWKNLERFALKCRLDVVSVDMEDWSESVCGRFESLVTSTETVEAVILADTTPKRVELFVDGKGVSETLVEEKHAIIVNTQEQEPVDEIVDLELDPHSAFVSHNDSPSEFWIQEEKLVADLEVMADRFIVADMFPKIDDVKEGLLCVAKYPEDDKWYRARVVCHDDNGTQVIYIDYGNSAVSTDIRAIPEDLAAIPPLSRKCCLELPPRVREWSQQAREEFVRLSADGATTFLLDVLKEQETSVVKLTLDGQNVADILAGMCERHSPVIEERLPPLGEENSPNVVVSHINSPNEFWTQAESSINELEVMSDRLRDAESFLTLTSFDIGTICAARYPEDGYWYRARIVAHRDDSSEVLYMDYGNSGITTELRVLPEDIANIPMLSKRCALENPSCITAWNEAACNKFKELAAEGATMFQFEIVGENDPMYVRLSLNGTNVVDLLLAEYENIPETEDSSKEIKITSSVERQQEIVFQENEQLEKEISDLNKEVQELTFNQTNVLETGINNETLNNSFDNFNANEEYQYVGKPEEYYILNLKSAGNANENSKAATTDVQYERSSIVTELTVDQIVESMRRDSEDLESQNIDDTNLLDANKTQPQFAAQTDTSEPGLSQTESVNINEPKDPHSPQQFSSHFDMHQSVMEPVTEDSEPKEVSSVTNESQPRDATQLDVTQIKEEGAHSAIVLDTEEPIKSESLTANETLSASTNSVLKIQSKSADDLNSFSSESTYMIQETESSQSVIKTDPSEQCSYSAERSTDEIAPECVSRDESPPRPVRPATPKTPYSEKLVSGAVNPFFEPIRSNANEEDEILAVSVEDNIPKIM